MRVTMLLCDAAQVADGKLFVLGGGWSITGAQMGPSAIALKLEVPWDQTDVAHHWELYLVDADGRPVTIQTDDGQPPAPPDDTSGLTRWSWRAKALAVIAGFGMVAAFVFEFLPPTSSGGSQKSSTTVAVTTTTPSTLSTTTAAVTTTIVP